MIRKLAIALTLVSAGYAGVVQALGLGEAQVSSTLNQPLVAEIDLVNISGLSDEEILPGLATREEFLKAGIDRVYFLSDIRFEVKSGSDGQPKIVLTTKKPVREPFLNFLVEVIWPSGRLLREYALLIDPPVYAEDKPIAAAPASVASESQQAPSQPQIKRTSIEKGDNIDRSVRLQSGALAGNDTYGPTNSSDTLWDIATKVRPDKGVSPQQVMLAIQDLNPDAFLDGNINKLKKGQILRIPTRDQMASRSSYAAINEVIEQNAALRKPKTKTPVSSAKADKPAAPTKAKQGGDQLKLVVPEKDSKASDAASSDPAGSSEVGTASSEELSVTLEKLDAANLENDELTEKVDALEEQLETLQRILTLKNDQLAGLQAQMRASELEQAESDTLSDEGVDVDGEAAESELAGESELQEEGAESDLAQSEEQQVAEENVVSPEATEMDAAADEGDVDTEEETVQEAVSGQAVTESPQDPGKNLVDDLLEKIMTNPVYQGAAAGALILLLLLLWLLTRSKSDDAEEEEYEGESYESEDEESEYEEDEQDYDAESSDEVSDDDEPAEEGEGEGEGKEDVIEEADVYIAYGRLDQAATILEEGISNDPVRVDYRLKLLEVYRDSLQEEAFDKQVSELEAIQDQAALERAAEIREELQVKLKEQESADQEDVDVEHLLDDEEEQALLKGEDDNSFDFDTVEEPVETAAPVEPVAEPEQEVQVDDLEEYAEEAADEVGQEIDFESDELDVDLDIDLNLDEAPELDSTNEVEEDPGIDFESVDLDLEADLEGDEPTEEEKADLELGEDLELETEIELDLSDELELADESLELTETEEPDSPVEEDDLGLELDEELDLGSDEDLALEADLSEAELEDLELPETAEEDLSLDLDADSLELESDADAEAADDSADLLDLGDEDAAADLEITDETLDEAAEALGDAEDFEPELSEDDEFDFLEGTDEASTKLDLARAYIDMGDVDGAREILEEVEKEGSPDQQQQAKDLIASLGS